MKGNMSQNDFNAWVEFAAARRDTTCLKLEGTRETEVQAKLIAQLKEDLNKL